MKLRFHAPVADEERAEAADWTVTHNSDDVGLVVIEEAAIAVFAHADRSNRGAVGVAVRHGGRLTDELDEALAILQGKND